MHIRSKFDGGKQINHSQSGSWEGRCAGAGLRQNLGPAWGPVTWKSATGSEANSVFRSTCEVSKLLPTGRERLVKLRRRGENMLNIRKQMTIHQKLDATMQDMMVGKE